MTFQKGQIANPAGAARKLVPATALPMITKMIAEGKSEKRVALALKLSEPTWIQRKKDQPEVADAAALGHEMLREKIVGYLMAQAKKGNVIAGIYLSKALCGMRENDPATEARPSITINLPGALPMSELRGVTIEQDGDPLSLPAPATPTKGVRRG